MPVKLYPAPGMLIRDPAKGDYLPEEGRAVELDIFWRRRLRDQEVTTTPPAATATVASTTKDAAKTAALATTEGA